MGTLNEAGDIWETFNLVIKDYHKGICREDLNKRSETLILVFPNFGVLDFANLMGFF